MTFMLKFCRAISVHENYHRKMQIENETQIDFLTTEKLVKEYQDRAERIGLPENNYKDFTNFISLLCNKLGTDHPKDLLNIDALNSICVKNEKLKPNTKVPSQECLMPIKNSFHANWIHVTFPMTITWHDEKQ